MGLDILIRSGTCCVCGKKFKNTPRRTNIARDLEDGKIYCKTCALGKVLGEYFKTHNKSLNSDPQGKPRPLVSGASGGLGIH